MKKAQTISGLIEEFDLIEIDDKNILQKLRSLNLKSNIFKSSEKLQTKFFLRKFRNVSKSKMKERLRSLMECFEMQQNEEVWYC